MRALTAVASVALLALAFAGCSDDPERYPNGVPATSTSASSSATSTRSSTATSTGSSTQTSTGAGNQAPTASLTATPMSGTASLNVTFGLSGFDADGDSLTWTLAFGDDTTTTGTSLPANVTHVFTSVGSFTANLTVSDGTAQGQASILVTVSGPAAPVAFAPIHSEFTTAFMCEQCTDVGPETCLSLNVGEPGIDCGWVELPPEAAGHSYTVAASAAVSASAHVAFFAACTADSTLISTEAPVAGSVPAGAGCLVAWDFDGTSPNIAFVVDVT